MAIGDNWCDSTNYCWDDPPGSCTATIINADADLVVEGNVGIGTEDPGGKLEIADVSLPGDPSWTYGIVVGSFT